MIFLVIATIFISALAAIFLVYAIVNFQDSDSQNQMNSSLSSITTNETKSSNANTSSESTEISTTGSSVSSENVEILLEQTEFDFEMYQTWEDYTVSIGVPNEATLATDNREFGVNPVVISQDGIDFIFDSRDTESNYSLENVTKITEGVVRSQVVGENTVIYTNSVEMSDCTTIFGNNPIPKPCGTPNFDFDIDNSRSYRASSFVFSIRCEITDQADVDICDQIFESIEILNVDFDNSRNDLS